MPDALLHHSDRDTPPDEATPDWDNSPSFYCFNFLTQGSPCEDWSLTSPKEKLIKIGAKGRLPDGRSRHPTANVPGNFADDRRAAAAATSASLRRSMVMHSRSTGGRTAPKCQGKPDQALDAIRGARNVGSHPHLPFGLPNNSENRYNSH